MTAGPRRPPQLRGRRRLPPLAVRRYGTRGAPVVVLHGGPGAPGSVADLARRLGRRFRVAEPLQRRSGTVPLTMARNVTDLGQVVPGPVALVGWSWGAMWALSFAARYPGRVRTLVLVGCGTYDQDARGRYRAALERRLGPSRLRELAAGLAGTEAQRRRAFAHLGRTVAEAESFDPIPGRGRDPGMAALDPRGFDETWRDVLRRQRDGREPAAFRAIRCPVLMIHGRQDPHPGSRIAESLRPYLPQLVYRPLDRCGHTPWRERQAKEPFLWLLERWLERSDASARLPTPGR